MPLCLVCLAPYTVASLSGHLKTVHSYQNVQERRHVLNLCNGRTNIRRCPCPVPGCRVQGQFLERHLERVHRELDPEQLDMFKDLARKRETYRLLQELRDSNPDVPLTTTWDHTNDPGMELPPAPANPPAKRHKPCHQPACGALQQRFEALQRTWRKLKAEHRRTKRELWALRRAAYLHQPSQPEQMAASESHPSKPNHSSALSSAAPCRTAAIMTPFFTLEENDWSDTETRYLSLLPVCKEEDSPERQEMCPILEPSQIKEEPEERSPSLEPPQIKEEPEEELLQRPEEAAGSSLTLLAVKSEDDDGNRETEPLASTSTEHMKTQADVEHCGTSQPAVEVQLLSSHRSDSDITEDSDEWPSHRSDSDAEDSDEWDPSVLDRLKRGKKSFASTKCGQVSGSMGDVKKHMRTQTGEFVCSVCNKRFNQKQDVIKHMRFHKERRSFACSVCNKSLINGQSLRQHMLLHTGKKPFSCSVCRENFQYKYQLIKHMDTHTGGKPCDSSVSSKRFTQSLNLETHTTGSSLTLPAVISEDDDGNRETEPLASTSTEHMKTQADVEHCGTSQPTVEVELLSSHGSESDITEDSYEWPSHCSESDAEDSDEWEASGAQSDLNTLESHETQCGEEQRLSQNMTSSKQTPSTRSQTGKEGFCCTECGKVSGSKSDLKTHMLTHSGNKPFACSVCNKRFKYSKNLKPHMRTHTGDKPFACSVCEKSFIQSQSLTVHMRTHTGDKPFACSVCGKGFSQSASLKSHMTTHTGDKPLACSLCRKTFKLNAHLRAHMRTHTADKPFACSVCGKDFKKKNHLKVHMMTHTGDKPLACYLCGKSFKQIAHLKAHMRTHTGEKPFACSVCGKSFILSSHLKRHMMTHTGDESFACPVLSDGNPPSTPVT